MKIILLGAHGTGKTTLAKSLSESKGWPIIESPSRILHNVMGLTSEQYQEIITLMNMKTWDDLNEFVEPTIFCRTLIDNLSYNDMMKSWDNNIISDIRCFREYQWMLNHMKHPDDMLVIRIPIEFEMEKDGVRPESEEYRKTVDKRQQAILDALIEDDVILRENVCEVSGSVEERTSQIEKFIEQWAERFFTTWTVKHSLQTT